MLTSELRHCVKQAFDAVGITVLNSPYTPPAAPFCLDALPFLSPAQQKKFGRLSKTLDLAWFMQV